MTLNYPTSNAPGAPTSLGATAGDTTASLSWSAPSSNGGSAITAYKIYRDTSSPATTLIYTNGATTTYGDTGLTNGTTYYYRVKAVNAVGDSGYSNEASVVPAVPATITYISSNASASDGSSYTFSSQNIGTASADRYLLIGCYHQSDHYYNYAFTGCTVGGNAATLLVQESALSLADCAIYLIAYPTGTTANIVLSLSGSVSGNNGYSVMFGVWAITGLQSATPVATNHSYGTTINLGITTSAGGVAAAVAGTYANSPSWSGFSSTKNWSFGPNPPTDSSGISGTTNGSSITITYSPCATDGYCGCSVSLR